MTNASRDNNFIPTRLATSNADGLTPIPIQGDPTTHVLTTDNTAGGTDQGRAQSPRDQSQVTTMMAVSNVDGTTPVLLYVDSVTKKLLIKTT